MVECGYWRVVVIELGCFVYVVRRLMLYWFLSIVYILYFIEFGCVEGKRIWESFDF